MTQRVMYERKIKITNSVQDAFKLYKEEYGKISKKLYLAVAYELMKNVSNMIIKESFEYRIPEAMGFLRIRKKKQKIRIENGRIDINKNIINWDATWKAWMKKYPGKTRKEIKEIENKRVVFQTNDHTNGEVMQWHWDKSVNKVPNAYVYSFDPVKGGEFDGYLTGRLGLAKWIKSAPLLVKTTPAVR